MPQQPGWYWYIPTQLYYYNGSASATHDFQRGEATNLGVSSQMALVFFTPTVAAASGGGQRPSLAPHVTEMGPMDGATAAGGRSCCLPSQGLAREMSSLVEIGWSSD